MLRNYLPIYKIGLLLQTSRTEAVILKDGGLSGQTLSPARINSFRGLLEAIVQVCPDYGLTHTAALAKCVLGRPLPTTYTESLSELNHLNDSLTTELDKEALFRIPPERKDYFNGNDLFGSEVANAFPSCARDIQRAGSCYALEQEDACVHHLMLVLERGLAALAVKLGVTYQKTNWQLIIDQIEKRAKSLPRSAERDFYQAVNAQFGFLKVAYRNHSEHAHDDPYDMVKALHIFNQVKEFMRALERGGLCLTSRCWRR